MPRPDEKLIHDVVLLDSQKMKRRAIARALHISRNTVRRILTDQAKGRVQPHSVLPTPSLQQRPSILDRFRPQVDELMRHYPDITAQRVYEELRAKHFEGGYTGVKELVRALRPKPAPTPSLETPRREPGDLGECDWSSYPVRFTHAPPAVLQAFGYALRFSFRKYFGFHERSDLHALMAGHVHAFERFQGVPRRCKYDNQKPVVLRREGGQPIFNPRFIDFATYYEFSLVACLPRRPNEKPRVERAFYELTLSFFRGRSFRDFADLEGQLLHWMDAIADLRPIKRMRRHTRLELFAQEQPLLRPLPRHAYDTARVLYKPCDIEGFIAWEGNWYSLPYEYVTELLPVRITEKELFVYRSDLVCIARHALLPRSAQQYSILEGHRPRHADRGPDLDQLRGAFAAIDERAAAFLVALEKAQPRSAGYHARKLLALRERWGTDDLVRALTHALAYGALEHQSVERILLARGTPRRLDEYVAQASAQRLDPAHACNQPRDLAEYDALPSWGALPSQPGVPECPNEAQNESTPAVSSNLERPPTTKSESESGDT
jgi:transposase